MATTAGVLSQVSVTDTKATLTSAVATGGTAPYTYQWYRSTTTGFTPGGGNIIAGATALTLNDSGLIPNTAYFYKVIAIDAGAVASTSAQLAVATQPQTLSPNQFAQSTLIGMVDQQYNYNTLNVQIDTSQATPLYPGMAVKIVDSAGGIPKVVGCSANADEVLGFINYDIKTVNYPAGALAQVSSAGNVIYLYATGAIARGIQVQLDVTTGGGVAAIVGASGADVVGWALDKASAAGQLIRVHVTTPSFKKA